MKTETQLQVQAYLDNELSAAQARQVAELISADPGARAVYNELKDTREILASTGEAPLKLREKREFYWSQIERRIDAAGTRDEAPSRTPWWVRALAPLAGAVALFAVLLSLSDQARRQEAAPGESPMGAGTQMTAFHQIESTPEVSTITFRSEREGITVVWVDTDL